MLKLLLLLALFSPPAYQYPTGFSRLDKFMQRQYEKSIKHKERKERKIVRETKKNCVQAEQDQREWTWGY